MRVGRKSGERGMGGVEMAVKRIEEGKTKTDNFYRCQHFHQGHWKVIATV